MDDELEVNVLRVACYTVVLRSGSGSVRPWGLNPQPPERTVFPFPSFIGRDAKYSQILSLNLAKQWLTHGSQATWTSFSSKVHGLYAKNLFPLNF